MLGLIVAVVYVKVNRQNMFVAPTNYMNVLERGRDVENLTCSCKTARRIVVLKEHVRMREFSRST